MTIATRTVNVIEPDLQAVRSFVPGNTAEITKSYTHLFGLVAQGPFQGPLLTQRTARYQDFRKESYEVSGVINLNTLPYESAFGLDPISSHCVLSKGSKNFLQEMIHFRR